MKNTTLLNKLLRIEQNGSVNLDPDFLALLAEVKQEVYNEEKSFSSDQKRASKKVQVKDVANFFDNLDGLDYRVLADFYAEDGFYIGSLDRNCAGDLFVPDEVRAVWRNNIKFSRMYTLQETVMCTFVVLKGEEK